MHIVQPNNLNELLNHLNIYKTATILSGCVEFMSNHWKQLNGPLISISKVEELSKITRNERYLEIGAAVPLAKLINIGKNVIPQILYDSLKLTSTPSIRNTATIGGNICTASSYSTIIPALYAIDAKVEVRNIEKSFWVPIYHFFQEKNTTILLPGELLTRIRVPYGDWSLKVFKKFSLKMTQRYPDLIFCGLARILKNVVMDNRIVFGAIGDQIIRNRELESAFIGQRLPLKEKDMNQYVSQLQSYLSSQIKEGDDDFYKTEFCIRTMHWYLEELNKNAI